MEELSNLLNNELLYRSSLYVKEDQQMSQESINQILHDARLSGGAIDSASLQKIKKLPEYSDLLPAEKNALDLIDNDSIIAFLNSAEVRRKNAVEDNRAVITELCIN